MASGNPEQHASHVRIHGFGNLHLVAHQLADDERPFRLSLARSRARALSGGQTWRFKAKGLLDLAGDSGGVVGSETERLAGGGAARGEEDLVGG